MFCSKCGQEIADDASFCSKCGAPTGTACRPSDQVRSERQKTYDLLSSISQQLSGQRSHYNAIAKDNLRLAEFKEAGKDKGRWILSVVGGMCIWGISGYSDGDALATGLQIVSFVPFALCVIAAIRRRTLTKRIKEDVTSHLASIVEIYASVKDNPLAFEQSTPHALDSLLAIVRKGRADTLKEAINVYEDEVYKSRMLDLQKAAVNEASAARIAAEQAKEYAKRSQVVYYW